MKSRRNALSLLVVFAIALGALGYTLASDNKPALGLDLQGGISLVLAPEKRVRTDVLNQSIAIIRNRVDALGVGEPEINRQGSNIIVEIPGVRDQAKARDLVGQTAELRFRPVLQDGIPPEDFEPPTPTTARPRRGETTTTADPNVTTTTTAKPPVIPSTPPEDDIPSETVLLPTKEGDRRMQLGPALLTGEVVRTARAAFDQGQNTWYVQLFLTSKGSPEFDAMAAANRGKQVAIVLDGVIQSAPVIQEAAFDGKPTITGSFSQREASELALVLRYGALPVQLKEESVERISATLGKDSLTAGITAGAVGLALVLLYIILYYRALGLVVVLGLLVSASLLWSIISYLGENSGLALSLAGATGIIVSIGVTIDSYVVFFERLKDELKSGKTIRSSVDRGFSKAYRTIFAANTASLIGAGVLYYLTVGPVRGFAFFLGLSTLLDLVVAYFFTRPMVAVLANNRTFTEARGLGVARGLAAPGAT